MKRQSGGARSEHNEGVRKLRMRSQREEARQRVLQQNLKTTANSLQRGGNIAGGLLESGRIALYLQYDTQR